MKLLALVLMALLLALQYDLWVGEGSLTTLWQLQAENNLARADNQKLQARNDALAAEVEDLQTGMAAIEERARSELGMVKQHETFVQVIDVASKTPDKSTATSTSKPDTTY